jgi:hypothetical protein
MGSGASNRGGHRREGTLRPADTATTVAATTAGGQHDGISRRNDDVKRRGRRGDGILRRYFLWW